MSSPTSTCFPAGSLFLLVVAVGLFSTAAPSYASCGASFCSVNSDLDMQGPAYGPGMRVGLRYEFLKQDQLRSGTKKVSPQGVPDTHDETSTYNRNLLATFDYMTQSGWGLTAEVPILDRTHTHVYNKPTGGNEVEAWDYSELGDIKIMGRYEFSREAFQTGTGGLKLGARLPTGGIDATNQAGERAERSLQPGTGSTALIVGGYYRDQLSVTDINWFLQGIWQHSIATRDEYRPGDYISLDVGMGYAASHQFNLLLQLNTQIKGRDLGANAEPDSSGGIHLSLSPGVSYAVSKNTKVYSFFQTPVYEHVNGAQLTADWSTAIGISYGL